MSILFDDWCWPFCYDRWVSGNDDKWRYSVNYYSLAVLLMTLLLFDDDIPTMRCLILLPFWRLMMTWSIICWWCCCDIRRVILYELRSAWPATALAGCAAGVQCRGQPALRLSMALMALMSISINGCRKLFFNVNGQRNVARNMAKLNVQWRNGGCNG